MGKGAWLWGPFFRRWNLNVFCDFNECEGLRRTLYGSGILFKHFALMWMWREPK